MNKSDVLQSFVSQNCFSEEADWVVTRVVTDSNQAVPDSIFVALPSVWEGKTGGEAYISQAIKNGARLIITKENPPQKRQDLTWIQVENPHKVLSQLARKFYPEQPETVVAVTGTNGKSSIVDFIFQIWQTSGFLSARMGTIGVKDSLGSLYEETAGMTTPDAVTIHRTLQRLKQNKIQYLAMESSSHALVQHRMDSVQIKLASFTNLTHEHLDYHQDIRTYFAAKTRLFEDILPQDAIAIVNVDDAYGRELVAKLKAQSRTVVTYGETSADFMFTVKNIHSHGMDVELNIYGRSYSLLFPLIGSFQISNAVCAVANAVHSGVEEKAAVLALEHLQSVSGRLQKVSDQVYVDYAHTPDALSTALKALRGHCSGALSVVFGCGGNRDPFKRPLMGKIAAELADRVYITDDNPRFEDPVLIRQQIIEACPGAFNFSSRKLAIYQAIQDLSTGDMLLIAGKGHETGQIVGDVTEPFNDTDVAREALREDK
ncbi:MAG: UDP-N-acetylmuramoyl-L-alanyl-D-glutamate--2,6-diaminopimelate ligase [Alphaproteobacteria bacterium]|nr:UDP-N-acetylmuramoyl-L-alanyl-D-glutamate--2,6-diaminopimelate ligase [Alphaproteobacteria bacterium]